MNGLLIKTKNAHKKLIRLSNVDRNNCLLKIKDNLLKNIKVILEANCLDIEAAKTNNLMPSFIERLTLTEERLTQIANSIDDIIKLEDVIGNVIEEFIRPNGIQIKKVVEPFGVICAIFESRPNVAIDISVLCLKTANCCVLKGGKEAINTNKVLVEIMTPKRLRTPRSLPRSIISSPKSSIYAATATTSSPSSRLTAEQLSLLTHQERVWVQRCAKQ